MLCEKCHREIFKFVQCTYCNRKICNDCMKSSKRKSKSVRLIICKECWSIMPRRKVYKSTTMAPIQQQQERFSY